jgi:hypothetical protein
MDSSYCHLSYWFPHVIINMPTFQIHFMSVPHACGLLGVLNILYSQCCGMAAWILNCLYRCQWNGAPHYGHLFLATIKVIRHCRWYTCWQVPKIHAPFGPNGEQQIRNSSPFCMKGWGVGHKNSLVFVDMMITYSQSSLGCVTQLMLALSAILGKLSRNISNILGHDVKACDWNLPFSCFTYILTNSASIYIAWDATKIHARFMWFEFHLVAFTNISQMF